MNPPHQNRIVALRLSLGLMLLGWLGTALVHGADSIDPKAAEFFEKEIRPLLLEKCSSCHTEKKTRGGLRLTSRDLLLKGGDSGPAVVPGKPEQSLLIKAVEQQGDVKMPPKNKLTPADVNRLKHWVSLGAPWPSAVGVVAGPDREFRISDEQRRFWAFQPVRPLPPPAVKNGTWAQSDIDRFILAKLEANGLTPAAPADKRTLLRRATFDLTGLPPTPKEIDAFLHDESPDAFAKVIDRLLASPTYGERWGRHWLDVVRYTDYFAPDPPANLRYEPFDAFRYRDWVVDAFNRDLPYDQFLIHQVAGDRLANPKGGPVYPEGLIATTMLSIGAWDNGDADKDKIVTDIVDDQIEVVGKAFLGLTLMCARCHDHKFDPIAQKDYYGLAGIFFSSRILADLGAKGDSTVSLRIPLADPAVVAQRDQQIKRLSEIGRQEKRLGAASAAAALGGRFTSLTLAANGDFGPSGPLARLRQERATLNGQLLPAPPLALATQEGGIPGSMFPGIQDVPVHIRGSYLRLGPVVPRHFPEILAGPVQEPIRSGSGRLELARWLARPENPLTARVMVNRVWQGHFGEGIVRTPNNFGKLGDRPTHPELLDYLAGRFVQSGWSVKALHRAIMLSATYRQASAVPAEQARRDPDNRWFGRFNARRLEAEAIRDSMLVVAGRLDRTRGGPASSDVKVPRRSLYVQTTRYDRSNFSTLFDAANPEACIEQRGVSTVTPQALFLLNHEFVLEQAKHLAARLRALPGDDAVRIQQAYAWLFGRAPRDVEVRIGKAYLERSAKRGAEAAWTDYAHVLLCSNEFVYLD